MKTNKQKLRVHVKGDTQEFEPKRIYKFNVTSDEGFKFKAILKQDNDNFDGELKLALEALEVMITSDSRQPVEKKK